MYKLEDIESFVKKTNQEGYSLTREDIKQIDIMNELYRDDRYLALANVIVKKYYG